MNARRKLLAAAPILALLCLFATVTTIAAIHHARRTPTSSTALSSPGDDVTAGLQKLLRTSQITAEVFTCPATQPSMWDFGTPATGALDWSRTSGDSTSTSQLSYRFQNPFAARPPSDR